MNVLSNIAQPSVSAFGNTGSNDGGHSSMYETKGTTRASAGFTLLQGHIQLMAMVPNLPENQTSPRWKGQSKSAENCDNYDYSEGSNSTWPITPRMMPSASKFKRLPSILASKASQYHHHHHRQHFGHSGWQPPRSISNLSLPPKQSQPITMPSFAKCLPGTKRAIGHGTAIMPMPNGTYENGGGDCQPSSSPCFPIIPSQPSFQTSTQTLQLINKENYSPEQQQVQTAFVNPYTAAWLQPQMAYQMVNVVPSSSPLQQQQQYEYLGGSGDSSMASVLQQIQQQQTYEQCSQQSMAYPYQCYPQHVFGNDMFQYSQQPPYAVQSMPCFGTPCTSSYANAMHNFQFSGNMSSANKATVGHSNGLVLPPVSTAATSPQPVYSASMPEICFNNVPPHQASNLHREQIPLLVRKSNKKGTGSGRKEVSIVVESSSTTTSSSSSSEEECPGVLKSLANKSPGASKTSKSISVLKLREIQREKEEKKAREDAKYAALGPESDPGKIPTIPRVANSPVTIQPKPKTVEKEESEEKTKDENKNEKCGSGECCTRCKCCMKNKNDESNQLQSIVTDNQQPPSLEEKVREMKSKLTPRRKGKQFVVAVHDCFPSDSSVTEAESEENLTRKSCFNYTTGNNGAIVRKRKPRIDAILKTKLKGDSSEVFDDLDNDLNPDEARTFTCDYLVELLTSEDWNNCYTALQIMIRLARHRPKVLLNYLSGPILWCTFHHITSPKSALCRAAIVTFKELFQRIGSALDNDLEKITEKLVLKSLAPNMFIREECDRALEAMVAHCNLVKVLNAMDIVTKKPHARAAGHRLARMALQIVQVAGVDMCLKPMYAEKLLPMLFCFMTEANNGTRTAAKEALAMLMNHLQFETAITRHVAFDRNCTEVFKKLDKMRGRNRSRRQVGNVRFPLPHAHFRR